jgi:superfamily I DNA/RNA helicase
VELQKNYRSTQEIVNISNWLRLNINDSYHEVKATKGSSLTPALISEEDFESSMEKLCKFIRKLLEEGSQVEDIAVLVRTNKQIKRVGKALAEEKILVTNDKGSFGVELLTMHGSKGKGFKHVFVIDPRFGYSELDTKYCEQRLLYVALTRAKSSLTIVQNVDGKALYSDAKKGINSIDEMTRPLVEMV